ncbi:MAG: hypothetical protein GWN62_03700 [Aliifodinibius sp.]|nr:hypothetical protein [Fodinibius sp.]NIW78059.1 hypothetical protein [Calditrichia bacterium]
MRKKYRDSFYLLTFFTFIWFICPVTAQQDTVKTVLKSSKIDTARLFSDKPVKSPYGALLRSAVLPGWGQLYNERPYKAAFSLALNGVLAWRIIYYHNKWKDEKDSAYRDKRIDFTWYLGVAYVFNLIDAYVDAYLFGFNKAFEISGKPAGSVPVPFGLTLELKF